MFTYSNIPIHLFTEVETKCVKWRKSLKSPTLYPSFLGPPLTTQRTQLFCLTTLQRSVWYRRSQVSRLVFSALTTYLSLEVSRRLPGRTPKSTHTCSIYVYSFTWTSIPFLVPSPNLFCYGSQVYPGPHYWQMWSVWSSFRYCVPRNLSHDSVY